jgi:hypothetical protein
MKMTPLGLNPKECDVCGEWIGSSKALTKTSRGHVLCFNTLVEIQELASSENPDINAILELTMKTIGDRRDESREAS